MNVLYLSYTGLMEPLGESQVLAYLERLADRHQIDLVSFEKPEDWADRPRRAAMRARAAEAGIRWHPLRYHRRVPLASTAYDVARALAVARRLVRERDIEVVHARAYVASVVALRLQRAFGVRFIFDMRAFWPDERVDAGQWTRRSLAYRVFKRLERSFLLQADAVVTLTEAAAEAVRGFDYLHDQQPPISVISTCADLSRFSPPAEMPAHPFTFGYVGNTTGGYRFEPVAEAFSLIRERLPDARLLVVNRDQHDYIRATLRAASIPETAYEIKALDFAEVPHAIRQMHAASFFLTDEFGNVARAPTRLAELLGCGVPCLIRGQVGDAGRIVEEDGVGVSVDSTDRRELGDAVDRLLTLTGDPAVRAQCVATAKRHFSLEAGVEAYDALYRRLSRQEGAPRSSTQ